MTQNAAKIQDYVKDKVEVAQARILNLEEEARKLLKKTQAEGKRVLDELLDQVNWKELVEKLRHSEFLAQSEKLRRELYEVLGLVSKEEFAELKTEFAALQKELASVKKAASKAKKE